ncbi:TPA: pentapeptide repeat-containing protein [Candidatus Woesearchaeota archaeon]|nr:pentapeptide repeat-containing protein [Candidatus Woesearchaeota archaeon]
MPSSEKVEETIESQVQAMLAWAITSKNKADSNDYAKAEEQLQNINRQGRKLEWGIRGLRTLPPRLDRVYELKTKIAQARAASQVALSNIKKIQKVPSQEGKDQNKILALKKSRSGYQKEIGKNISIIIEVLKKADDIVSFPDWLSPEVLSNPQNKSTLILFLKKHKCYRFLPFETRAKIMQRINFFKYVFHGEDLRGADFSFASLVQTSFTNADCREVDFSNVICSDSSFDNADLRNALFHHTTFKEVICAVANLEETDLRGLTFLGGSLSSANCKKIRANTSTTITQGYAAGTNFQQADLTGVDFSNEDLHDSNFTGAKLVDATLSGAIIKGANLTKADLKNVNGLTKEQFYSAKNRQKALNIPPRLL